MEPIRIFESVELLLAGCLVKYEDGKNDWAKWEEMDSKSASDQKYVHNHLINGARAHSVFFYPHDGIYIFTGLEVTGEASNTAWEYLKFPSAIYAVFELDYKVDQGSQYHAFFEWIEQNKDQYKRTKWDANGQVVLSEFAIYIYDHEGKFKKDKIVEMWIPLVKV